MSNCGALSRVGVGPHQKALCPVPSGRCIRPSGRPVQVGEPGEARAPVLEAAVVLVLISQAGEDGAQCPCHGPIAFVVIDESSVVGRDAEVTVRSFQALRRGPRSSGPQHTHLNCSAG